MAETTSFVAQQHYPSEPKLNVAPLYFNASSQEAEVDHRHAYLYSASEDEIPTVDYLLLFSDDPVQRFLALENLRQACQEYGFFYLVNHNIPGEVLDSVLKGFSGFCDPKTIDERKVFGKSGPSDKIRWDLNSSAGENREYLKVVAHPQFHSPSNPSSLRKNIEEYHKAMRMMVVGLARAVSKTLGFEEDYIEKEFNLKSGFDVMALNLYPPNSRSKGAIGIPEHTDPGFVITLVQDVDGGLQILSHQGKWINVHIPHHAILIQLGDHLEILTNGKYKSHIHRVIVKNNEVQRISVVTLHGPALDKFISPSTEFVDRENQQKYQGMTYKESLEANGGDEIDVQSSLEKLRLV
ncbi:flavanone 3-dioxygenase 3 [Cajanus cajan]|uniref:Leucoanthocyanidin dioxygenase n=2 Tax=Cajanus cajan TaxID=3821 RepID=A0A151SZF0_CAJCA|nr:flavanone 3-dioxygenase 3 [Cajanus cajan]KYP60190.1 Leucoanthocyanidin dioxygenase [Cajanus cajan]